MMNETRTGIWNSERKASPSRAEQGDAGLDFAREKAMAASNNMGSPFGVRPNRNLISKLFEVAKKI